MLKLATQEDIQYMRNSNGVFFDVGLLSDDVLTKVDNTFTAHKFFEKAVSNLIY